MKRILRVFLLLSLIATPSIVNAAITASFSTTNNRSGCGSGIFVSFVATVNGCSGTPQVTYYFTNTTLMDTVITGGSSTGSTGHNFNVQGCYNVAMRAVCGTDTAWSAIPNYVCLNPAPTINFTTTNPGSDTIVTCSPHTVHFVNITNSDTSCPGHTWTWFISGPGGTTTVSGTNMTNTFVTPGSYTIRLLYNGANPCGCFGTVEKVNYIKIDSPATACFTRTDTASLCHAPVTVSFSSACSSGATSYFWTFGAAGTLFSTTNAITKTFNFPGNYPVFVTAITTAGCSTTVAAPITIHVGSFVANFRPSVDTICAGQSATFSDSSYVDTGSAVNYAFYSYGPGAGGVFPPGPSSFSQHATFTFSTPGDYIIVDSPTNGYGCTTAGIYRHIFVRTPPTASFTADTLYKCSPTLTAHFTATPIVASNTYAWVFAPGASGTYTGVGNTGAHHTFIYSTSGSFSPALTVTDQHGCSSSTSQPGYIKIGPPAIHIQADADSGCATTNGNARLVTYHVSISGVPASTIFIVDSIYFNQAPTGWAGGCYGCTDVTHAFNTGGIKWAYVRWHLPAYLGGCSGLDSVKVLLGANHPQFHISLSPQDSVCPHTTILFNDSCTNCASQSWTIRTNQNSVYTSTTDTTSATFDLPDTTFFSTYPCWPVEWIGSVGGCTDTLDTCVYVFPPAVFAGSLQAVTPNCANRDSFSFTINQVTFGATANYYSWNFGDGNTATTPSTGVHIGHQYTVNPPPGSTLTYTVTVTAHSTTGTHSCDNSVTKVISYGTDTLLRHWLIDNLNTPIANDSVGCKFDVFKLIGPLQPDGQPYFQYIWHFGDGTPPLTVAGPNDSTTHAYSTTSAALPGGVFRDTVILRDHFLCLDTARVRTVRITGPNGGFSFSPHTVCDGSNITFNDLNTDPGTIINNRIWTFNAAPVVSPSSVTTLSVPVGGSTTSMTFTGPGTYHIILNDSDVNHCYSYDTATLNVVAPRAYFYTSDTSGICAGLPIAFHDTNINCTYSWNFGDGGTSTVGPDVTHIYTANGTYNVSITIVSNGTGGFPVGCSNTYTIPNYIHVANVTDVGIDNFGDVGSVGCPPLHLGVGPTPSPTNYTYSYVWHIYTPFQPTITDSSNYVFTDITTSGPHTVVLIGTTPRGCVDSVSEIYTVGGPAGYITMSADSGCVPVTIHLTYTDTGSIAAGSNFLWNSCPQGTSTSTVPYDTLVFTTPGVYCPPSVVIQNPGCVVTISNLVDSIRIYPVPNVTVTQISRLCYGQDSTLTASGADYYSWAPAAGLACSTCAIIPINKYNTTTYTVTGITIHGCSDTAISVVRVDSPIIITITGKDSVCIGLRDTLVANGGMGSGLIYTWDGTQGSNPAVPLHPEINYVLTNSTNTYWVHVINSNGCTDSASFKVTINPDPLMTYTPDPAHVCFGDSTLLNVAGAASYIWKPRLGLSCDSCASPWTHIGNNIIYSVTGTSIHGCRDSINVPVTVYYHTPSSVRSDTVICDGDVARLYASGGESYIWRPSKTLNDSTSYLVYATPTVTTVYTVFVRENPCFVDTHTVKVTVIPIPILRMPPTTTIIAGNSVQLYADTLNHVILTSYAWTPADSTLTCTDCPRPIATPIVTTTYSVTASTIEGCAGHGTVTIKLLCETNQVFIPNTFTPNGDGLNDRFYVSGKGLGLITRMAIYNRWGELVYEGLNIRPNDPGVGWDGTFRGEVVAPDVFVYVLEVLCSTGEPFTFRGDVSLVR